MIFHPQKLRLLLVVFLSPLCLFSQSVKPDNWNEIIAKPWYYGIVSNKPAFAYITEREPETGWFVIADKALPDIHRFQVKWKSGKPKMIRFQFRDDKVKARFIGLLSGDTISGYLKTSRKNAIRLGVSPRQSVFMVKEVPVPLPALSPRYRESVFPNVGLSENISYGAATGYYSSLPVETEGYDYQEIILDAMEKMYVNPTKEALVHLFNRDPVSFALTDLQALRLDLYMPAGDGLANRPLVLLLHGGAFILGDKATTTIQEIAGDLATKGYVVASVNYRMGFNPASKSSLERSAYRAVQDARAALRFLAANASQYRIDPHCVFLGGSSAGAITALNTAFMTEDERPESSGRNIWRAQPDLGGLDESTNQFRAEYTIRGVVNLWGAVSDTNLIDPGERIPVLSFHGNNDKIVPYGVNYPFLDLDTSLTSNIVTRLYGSSPIHKRLTSLGIHSELITLPGAGHEPQYEPGKYRQVMENIVDRTTRFYYEAMFDFPELQGPTALARGMNPPLYSVPYQENLRYFWSVEGGKIVPGSTKNAVRVVFLAEKEATVSLMLEHENEGSIELRIPVELP